MIEIYKEFSLARMHGAIHNNALVLAYGCVWFDFLLWLLPPKNQKPTKGLDPGSSFF
jgi:hypothetical protein